MPRAAARALAFQARDLFLGGSAAACSKTKAGRVRSWSLAAWTTGSRCSPGRPTRRRRCFPSTPSATWTEPAEPATVAVPSSPRVLCLTAGHVVSGLTSVIVTPGAQLPGSERGASAARESGQPACAEQHVPLPSDPPPRARAAARGVHAADAFHDVAATWEYQTATLPTIAGHPNVAPPIPPGCSIPGLDVAAQRSAAHHGRDADASLNYPIRHHLRRRAAVRSAPATTGSTPARAVHIEGGAAAEYCSVHYTCVVIHSDSEGECRAASITPLPVADNVHRRCVCPPAPMLRRTPCALVRVPVKAGSAGGRWVGVLAVQGHRKVEIQRRSEIPGFVVLSFRRSSLLWHSMTSGLRENGSGYPLAATAESPGSPEAFRHLALYGGQSVALGFDAGIALAHGGFQGGTIENRDVSSGIADEAGVLQAASRTVTVSRRPPTCSRWIPVSCAARPLHAIVAHQQPATQPLLDEVEPVADRGLGDLHQQACV